MPQAVQDAVAAAEAAGDYDSDAYQAAVGAFYAKHVCRLDPWPACLTRAIALYLAMHTGRRYTTLFTDEADGALDIERKRMFMAMKREVLRLGGYQREFFVSQTPELTAMADAVIDMDLQGRL